MAPKLIKIKNPDKEFHEPVDKNNIGNFMHPFRAILVGPPNSGKSFIVLNILINQKPDFDKIFLYHVDGDISKEYELLDGDIIHELPQISEINPSIKNLLIIEDINLESMPKNQKYLLDRLFGYVSTHKNLSVIVTAQVPFQIPVNLRRMCNILIIWKSMDVNALEILSRRFGLKSKTLNNIFKYELTEDHDSLMLDMTSNFAPFRKNIFEIFNINKYL